MLNDSLNTPVGQEQETMIKAAVAEILDQLRRLGTVLVLPPPPGTWHPPTPTRPGPSLYAFPDVQANGPETALRAKLLRVKTLALEDLPGDMQKQFQDCGTGFVMPCTIKRKGTGGDWEVQQFEVAGVVYRRRNESSSPAGRPGEDVSLLPWVIEIAELDGGKSVFERDPITGKKAG